MLLKLPPNQRELADYMSELSEILESPGEERLR